MSTAEHQRKHALSPSRKAAKPKRVRGEHARGLILVGLFKLSKALFFGAMGAGALHLIHKNIGDLVMHILDQLPVDPESHFVGMIMDKADLIGSHQLRQAGLFSFSYAVLCLIEGTGLILQKVWAEYFTVVITLLAFPVEIYELIDKFSTFKVVLIALNVVVLLYLLWILKRKKLIGPKPKPAES